MRRDRQTMSSRRRGLVCVGVLKGIYLKAILRGIGKGEKGLGILFLQDGGERTGRQVNSRSSTEFGTMQGGSHDSKGEWGEKKKDRWGARRHTERCP